MRQQLDRAIALLDTDDLSAHTLAWSAFNVLFEVLGDDATRAVVKKVKKKLQLGKVPGFFKHAGDPNAILPEHSPETAYLTIYRHPAVGRAWPEADQRDMPVWQKAQPL